MLFYLRLTLIILWFMERKSDQKNGEGDSEYWKYEFGRFLQSAEST